MSLFFKGIIRDTVTNRLNVYTKLDVEAEQKIRAAIAAATQAMQPPPDKAKDDKEYSSSSNESENKPSTQTEESINEDTSQNPENDGTE